MGKDEDDLPRLFCNGSISDLYLLLNGQFCKTVEMTSTVFVITFF